LQLLRSNECTPVLLLLLLLLRLVAPAVQPCPASAGHCRAWGTCPTGSPAPAGHHSKSSSWPQQHWWQLQLYHTAAQ
jgi:hypothetical protein